MTSTRRTTYPKTPLKLRVVAAQMVIDHIHATNDPVLQSAIFLPLVESIKENPSAWIHAYGLTIKAPH